MCLLADCWLLMASVTAEPRCVDLRFTFLRRWLEGVSFEVAVNCGESLATFEAHSCVVKFQELTAVVMHTLCHVRSQPDLDRPAADLLR